VAPEHLITMGPGRSEQMEMDLLLKNVYASRDFDMAV
jgi:hypothetical protein